MTQQIPPLRQKVREIVSEAMLEAAEGCMIRNGFAATTMQQIAAEAGCAAGTLYLHFKNKDELFRAVVERRARDLFGQTRTALLSEADPLRKIQAGAQAFFRYADKNRSFHRFFFQTMPMRHRLMHEALQGETQQLHSEYQAIELQALSEAQHQGLVRSDIPPQRLQSFMGDVCLSLCEEFVSTEGSRLDDYLKLQWDLVGGGLGVRGGKH